ncbi:flavoprotein [Eubacterium oxidoreducens]|uniref:Flavoprotein n=1 Tax=Eubacterium oxidoreducens TaxID=1732 RepID=A0A1G6BX34_EUBOX|nr:flavoprotein [Eubacterium oxidoreducens]SDB25189.1 Flavoprotein [Eubacterium oxidoreducens]
MLENKTILLGVCGCTPAGRAVDIATSLRSLGAEVKIIPTKNALNFVTPLMLQRASANPIQIDQFDSPVIWDRTYQSWTLDGDLLLIAPASADMLGKLANGIADDLLSTNVLSFEGPKLIAMNMSPMLYRNAAVQRNVQQLAVDGYYFIDNHDSTNPCRMPSVDDVVNEIVDYFHDRD